MGFRLAAAIVTAMISTGSSAAWAQGSIYGWWFRPLNSELFEVLEIRRNGETTFGRCLRAQITTWGSADHCAGLPWPIAISTFTLNGDVMTHTRHDGVRVSETVSLHPSSPGRRIHFEQTRNVTSDMFEMLRPPSGWGRAQSPGGR